MRLNADIVNALFHRASAASPLLLLTVLVCPFPQYAWTKIGLLTTTKRCDLSSLNLTVFFHEIGLSLFPMYIRGLFRHLELRIMILLLIDEGIGLPNGEGVVLSG